MSDFAEILVLAIVQGLTEFLPVSSSGHVVVVGHFLQVPDLADLNILLHLGTLGSILVFYWRRIVALLREDRRLIGMLALGTAPAVLVGLPLKKWGPEALESPRVAGAMLIVTGLVLIATRWIRRGDQGHESVTWRQALLVGMSQAVAILPGLSRSGSTIATGVSTGLAPRGAATFSFLLAIPVIAGGGLLEFLKLDPDPSRAATPSWQLACGALVAFAVGLVALMILSRMVERGQFSRFAWWCIPVGIAVLVWM